jgi:hypothetical protein
MRALVSSVHRKFGGTALVLAPTGKAVDVAVREVAGDRGYTIARALSLLDQGKLNLAPATLVFVDEAAMIGTDDLRRLVDATDTAKAKAVLVGDAHQLAPVKGRGGMFAQLCRDLPGPNIFRRCGVCATQANAPHHWRCAMVARPRFGTRSTGTAATAACTVSIRSR